MEPRVIGVRLESALQRVRATVSWRPVILASTGAGLLLVGLADQQSRIGGPMTLPLFWTGILLIVGPSIWRLLAPEPTRDERISIALLLGLALYLVKVMASPIAFTLADEFTHWRTLDDVLSSGHLFADNPLLSISPVYPGMEAAAAAATVSSGLGVFPLVMILMGAARVVMVLSLFLAAGMITHSGRVAGIAAVIYMANPSFLSFDAQFSYESLALPLALLAIWAVLCWSRHRGRSVFHGGLALAAIAATTVTHPLTSFVLVTFLTTWAVVSLVRSRGATPRWPIVVAAAWAVAVNIAWLAIVGASAFNYLGSVVKGSVADLLPVLTGTTPVRQLFATQAGFAVPLPEMVVAYGSVALLLLALPFMVLHAVRGRHLPAVVVVLVLAAVLYPASLALRLAGAGTETSQRASEFLYVALGVLGADWLVGTHPSRWRPHGRPFVVLTLLVVFAGGIVIGGAPWSRLPGPYHVAAEQRSIEPQGTDTAAWALSALGPDNRLITNRTNAKLLGSIGSQYPVTSANSGLGTAYVMFAQTLDPAMLDVIRRARIRYVVVDLRLASAPPVYGVYFERSEPDAGRHTTPMPLAALQKFDGLRGVTRIYDSGDIIIYDVQGLVDGTP